MLGTDFRTGSPNWLDLASPDTAAAAAFYGKVFGWEFVPAGPGSGGYGLFRFGGNTVAALGPATDRGARSAWTVHFQSPDVQATAAAVRAGGGSVRTGPVDVTGEGRLARFTDPQGAPFACRQPGRTGGLETATTENALEWVELHAPDPVAAIGFYAWVFGWRYVEEEITGTAYRVLSVGEGDLEAGSFGGVAPQREGMGGASSAVPCWVPYFRVTDVDATASAVEGNGGVVLTPAADVPGVGRTAWVRDPCGAVFAVLTSVPRT
ncbi:VOC family protein [Streptomyces sp. NRRL S-87]|uniref:VOC family protein n=1 Tax=Streptomyces sp. NRRL S-87 TaxID=1463920 RepID=UPI0004C13B47|nr:VOC family protein [Streptomyces sp. NRRL S-87]